MNSFQLILNFDTKLFEVSEGTYTVDKKDIDGIKPVYTYSTSNNGVPQLYIYSSDIQLTLNKFFCCFKIF